MTDASATEAHPIAEPMTARPLPMLPPFSSIPLAPEPITQPTDAQVRLKKYLTRIIEIAEQVPVQSKQFQITIPSTREVVSVSAPTHWSPIAVGILADKYFRKAGVPAHVVPVEDGRPYPRHIPAAGTSFGAETDADQVFHRLAGAWTHHAVRQPKPLFNIQELADLFYKAVYHCLRLQWMAPNSPQWFNTGLHWAYGITKQGSGHFIINPNTQAIETSVDSYSNPQAHACFIQDVDDDLIREGGILDLWLREARVFKMGSGSGANYSKLRGLGEPLSGGGKSSGMMSFLHTGDRNAGSIKSGGTTRRAARMIVVDIDHPEIEEFIVWKSREERKVAALITGSKLNAKHARLIADAKSAGQPLDKLVRAARREGVEAGFLAQVVGALDNGLDLSPEIFDSHWEGEAYQTISGQNANNTVRVMPNFMTAVEQDQDWVLTARLDGSPVKTVKATELWRKIAEAAWQCADPGIHFSETINKWHTCAADGEIRASNPCSEYLFLDDTGCNLASTRLTAFLRDEGEGWSYDIETYEAVNYITAFILEVTVAMAQYPSKRIAERTRDYRTLGLGYADLGGLLMLLGVPYDSATGRSIAASLASTMSAAAYAMSADLANVAEPFAAYSRNRPHVLQVMKRHHAANDKINARDPIANDMLPKLVGVADRLWSEVVVACEHGAGIRNAQASVLAPTGTIGLVMDCATTGVEPDFALKKYKSLAGGGGIEIANPNLAAALPKLGYSPSECQAIEQHVVTTGEVFGAPHIKEDHLSIFDCATGTRAIQPAGHVLMMGAIQPFISGAISKTVNMPATARIDDIVEIHNLAYKSGVKAIAVYRDGCKLSQPLNAMLLREAFGDEQAEEMEDAVARHDAPKVVEIMTLASARKLPNKRKGYTQKAKVGDHKIFLRTGEFEDGSLGEIFIDMHKEGSAFRALLNAFAMAVSLGLQYRVPLEKMVEMFVFTRFEPGGFVQGHDRIKNATSLIDFIFRDLAVNYLGRDDLAHVAPPSSPHTDLGLGSNEGSMISDEEATRTMEALPFKAAPSLPRPPAPSPYTGEICGNCNSSQVKKTGTCSTCMACGHSVGGCV